MKPLNENDSTVSPLYRKNCIVKQENPFFVLNLASENDWIHQLPRHHPRIDDDIRKKTTKHLSKRNQQFLNGHPHNTLSTQAVVMSLELLKSNSAGGKWEAPRNSRDDSLSLSEEEQELLVEGFTIIPQHVTIDWHDWISLYCRVKRDLRVLHVFKCSVEYATRTIYELSQEELEKACHLVKQKTHIPKLASNKHALSQVLQELPPITLLVMLDSFCDDNASATTTRISHSCLPNTILEYNSKNHTVDWIALYDIESNEELFESRVDSSLARTARRKALRQKFGLDYNCMCIRCETTDENNNSVFLDCLSTTEMQRLGNKALLEERYEDARQWYRRILSANKVDIKSKSDTWHALGATFLHQGQFLKAQHVWKEASITCGGDHRGIALQVEKQQAYLYFDAEQQESQNGKEDNSLPTYTDIFESGLCFTTDSPVITENECRHVTSLAEASEWSTSRHYAVPTHDVAIHTIPALLSWFNTFMRNQAYPLLARQFQKNPNCFYVHDAFVVKYQAQQRHSYLPMHYDESTHSLVLTLNNDYEGGGTYFIDHDTVVNPSQAGCLVSFRGDKLKHGGEVVTSNIRYILAVFLYYDEGGSNDTTVWRDAVESSDDRARKKPRNNVNCSWKEALKERGFSFGFAM
jgi:tetratricopeptide (TPR) repeat protein